MKYSELLAVIVLVVALVLFYFERNRYLVYGLVVVSIIIILVGAYDEKAVGKDITATQTTPLSKTPYSDPMDERGVVVCAGGQRNLEALAGLKALRYMEERDNIEPLPVEWYYVGDEEVNGEQRKFIEEYIGQVEFRDVKEVYDNPEALKGWAIKPFALTQSKFRDTLLLDSDCVPLSHPSHLFNSKKYQEKGNIHWKDVKNLFARPDLAKPSLAKYYSNPDDIHYVYDNVDSSESGQMLVDRERYKNALIYAWRLNEKQDNVYKHTYGDKDTFVVGYAMDGKPLDYTQSSKFPDRIVKTKGRVKSDGKLLFGGKVTLSLVHMDDDDNDVFLHRTGQKRFSGGTFDLEEHKAHIKGSDDILETIRKTEDEVLASGLFAEPVPKPDKLFPINAWPFRKDISNLQ